MDRHNKMLIDATHPEETRVVVLRNGRIEEFDYESASRKLLRGNIYLAKVTRVEPSLQAAFVDYGGNRHGFLAFSEIHPDYYQIPVADRELLKQEEAEEEARLEAEADERASRRGRRDRGRDRDRDRGRHREQSVDLDAPPPGYGDQPAYPEREATVRQPEQPSADGEPVVAPPAVAWPPGDHRAEEPAHYAGAGHDAGPALRGDRDAEPAGEQRHRDEERYSRRSEPHGDEFADGPEPIGNVEDVGVVEVNGGDNGNGEAEQVEEVTTEEDALEEVPERPRRRMRQYKIQEVIKRRQIILVQVVKEERGNKGAALTTYISLAGRYTVLMPNTGRGGGISRKITQPQDRKRLKSIAEELDVPEGMGLIIRTAGAARTKQEIKRDYEYLLRLWESVRELTLSSTAPCLVYEEGNLIKRSIRDLYSKDIDQVVVAGGGAHREAHDFMGMLMPGHADSVARYDGSEPLFTRFGIERQLNAMFSPYVTLRSGGYLVINQTEALVAIDVNSGKSTREFSIEETAFNTNVEAAEEIARQLKLRDLAGLIVVDFIDMEEKRNNRSVERRLKDALRHDRARIQVGRISHFGLLEMSRQRLRTGVLEGSTSQCPHCQGTGIIRSTESVALAVLRGLEDQLIKQPSSLVATTTSTVALYILNHKRSFITDMEARHGIQVTVEASDRMQGATFSIEKAATPASHAQPVRASGAVSMDWGFDGTEDEEDADRSEAPREREKDRDRDRYRDRERDPEVLNGNGHDHGHTNQAEEADEAPEGGEGEQRSGRRRRRRRGRRDRDGDQAPIRQSSSDDQSNGDERQVSGESAEPGVVAAAAFASVARHDDDDRVDDAAADRDAAEPGEPADGEAAGERPRRGRRRGRRGGRGRGREGGFERGAEGSAEGGPDVSLPGADQPVELDAVSHVPWPAVEHAVAAAGGDGHVHRAAIVEYVEIRQSARLEPSPPARILEPADATERSAEPVAPIPAYPPAAPQPMWGERTVPEVAQPSAAPTEPRMAPVEQAPEPPAAPVLQERTPAFDQRPAALAEVPEAVEPAPAPAVAQVAIVSATPPPLAPDDHGKPGDVPPLPPAAMVEQKAEEPPRPARRGWWQRRFGL